MIMDKERIKEIFSDKEFVTELLSLENPEDVQNLLKTKGIEADLDQICKLGEILDKKLNVMTIEDGEISEEELEDVAGGWFAIVMPIITTVIGSVIKSVRWKTGRW
jgi:hypothetical protein